MKAEVRLEELACSIHVSDLQIDVIQFHGWHHLSCRARSTLPSASAPDMYGIWRGCGGRVNAYSRCRGVQPNRRRPGVAPVETQPGDERVVGRPELVMVVRGVVRRSAYYDSAALMRVQQALRNFPGIDEAGVVMATPANLELLRQAGLDPAHLDAASGEPRERRGAAASDLVVMISGAGPDEV